jgi:hypothetical protein
MSSKASPGTELVNMTTVDDFTVTIGKQFGFEDYTIDLLKIDAEGQDNKVLVGASKSIQNSVG